MKLAFKKANLDNWVEREIAKKDAPYQHSHVELVFSDGSSFSSRAYASGSAHKHNGTSFEKLDFPVDHWDVIDLPLSAEEEQVARDFCVENDGEFYDFDGVLAFKLFLFHEDPNRWFCSEVVLTALQRAGYLRDLSIPAEVSPDRLYTAAQAAFK